MQNLTPKTPEKLLATVERVTFYSAENGYSVLKVDPNDAPFDAMARDGTVTVVGILPEVKPGETVEFQGVWHPDPKWGLQFRAEKMRAILPTSKKGIARYLADAVHGVGPNIAQKIVDHFGTNTLRILSDNPEKLHEVKGINEKRIEEIIKVWKANAAERDTMIFLQEYGVSARFAKRVYEFYGEETIFAVKENPYRLADEIYGIGFTKADVIAQEMGIGVDSVYRIQAGLTYALETLSRSGHTYAPRDVLIDTTAELLKLNDRRRIEEMIAHQVEKKDVFQDTLAIDDRTVEAYYLPKFYHSEVGAMRLLHHMLSERSTLLASSPNIKRDVKSYIDTILKRSDITLTEQQQGAIFAALTQKLSVLTGGPGTGKTTTLRMVIEALEGLNNRKVALAAPTGRAAKRLSEATSREASTIHRMLKFQPMGWYFEHDESNPLEIDMLILDETSMLDLVLFYNVLKALPPHAHLMLVGDIDQLPSVGAGNVLRDVIDSGLAHVTRLGQIFRQDSRSHIVSNAHKINQGKMPYLSNESDDFFFFRMEYPQEVGDMIVDLVVNRVPSKFGFDPIEHIQVLAPMYRGAIGVNALNDALQMKLNGHKHKAEVRFEKRLYRVGDKVMQTKNNYEKGIFNGDSGRITSINKKESTVQVRIDGALIDYKFTELEQLVLAYCISTHRSQGSEYPVVIMPVMPQQYIMLQRNLLYTAITRAQKIVILVGTDKAVYMAVSNDKVAGRFSGLRSRLQAIAGLG